MHLTQFLLLLSFLMTSCSDETLPNGAKSALDAKMSHWSQPDVWEIVYVEKASSPENLARGRYEEVWCIAISPGDYPLRVVAREGNRWSVSDGTRWTDQQLRVGCDPEANWSR